MAAEACVRVVRDALRRRIGVEHAWRALREAYAGDGAPSFRAPGLGVLLSDAMWDTIACPRATPAQLDEVVQFFLDTMWDRRVRLLDHVWLWLTQAMVAGFPADEEHMDAILHHLLRRCRLVQFLDLTRLLRAEAFAPIHADLFRIQQLSRIAMDDSEGASEPGTGRENESESEPGTGRENESESEPGTGRDSESASEPGTGRDSDSESESGTGRDSDSESESGTGRDSDSEGE